MPTDQQQNKLEDFSTTGEAVGGVVVGLNNFNFSKIS